MWTTEELQDRFARYRDRFWPGRLRRYRVVRGATRTLGAVGECIPSEYLIIIDVDRHASDYALRSTLLHEMAHAAAGARSRGHDSLFLAELEHLLASRARLSMGLPETGHLPALARVPDRFRRVKRALTRAYRQQDRAIEDLDLEETVDDQCLSDAFRSAGSGGMTWRHALQIVAMTYGLLDIDGKPVDFVLRSLPLYRRAHRDGKRQRIKENSRPTV